MAVAVAVALTQLLVSSYFKNAGFSSLFGAGSATSPNNDSGAPPTVPAGSAATVLRRTAFECRPLCLAAPATMPRDFPVTIVPGSNWSLMPANPPPNDGDEVGGFELEVEVELEASCDGGCGCGVAGAWSIGAREINVLEAAAAAGSRYDDEAEAPPPPLLLLLEPAAALLEPLPGIPFREGGGRTLPGRGTASTFTGPRMTEACDTRLEVGSAVLVLARPMRVTGAAAAALWTRRLRATSSGLDAVAARWR